MTTPTKRYVGCAGSPEFCTMAQVGQNWTCMSDPLLPCRLPPCATISMFLNAALILASPPLPWCLLVSLSSVSIVLQVAIMCDHQSSILNSFYIHCPAGGHHVRPSKQHPQFSLHPLSCRWPSCATISAPCLRHTAHRKRN